MKKILIGLLALGAFSQSFAAPTFMSSLQSKLSESEFTQDKTHFEILREKFEFVLQERNPISLSNIPDLESPISYNCISFDRHNRAGHSIIGKTKSGISRATPNLSRNLLLFRFKSEVNSDQTLRDSFKKQYQDLRNRVDDSFFIDHNSTTDSKLVSEVPKDNVGGFYSDAGDDIQLTFVKMGPVILFESRNKQFDVVIDYAFCSIPQRGSEFMTHLCGTHGVDDFGHSESIVGEGQSQKEATGNLYSACLKVESKYRQSCLKNMQKGNIDCLKF